MRSRWPLVKACLACVLLFASTLSVRAMARRQAEPSPFPVELDHPYAAAFEILNRLPPDARNAWISAPVGSATDSASGAETVSAAEREAIGAALAAGRTLPPRWQADRDPLSPSYDATFIKSLSALGDTHIALAESSGKPALRDQATVDALALVGSVGPGLTMDDWEAQQERTLALLGGLQRSEGARTHAEAARLAEMLRALPPPVSFAEMAREDPLFLTPGAKLRRLLEMEAQALGWSPDPIGPASLRMSGLVVEPGRTMISLERADGSFWLEEGQTREGVTLVELDVPGQRARLRIDDREAILRLTSRRIEPWDEAAMERAAKSLMEKSDFAVTALLGERAGTLSDHLDKADAFGRTVMEFRQALARDPSLATDENPELKEEWCQRLMATAFHPLTRESAESFIVEHANRLALERRVTTAQAETLATLDRQAGGFAPGRAAANPP